MGGGPSQRWSHGSPIVRRKWAHNLANPPSFFLKDFMKSDIEQEIRAMVSENNLLREEVNRLSIKAFHWVDEAYKLHKELEAERKERISDLRKSMSDQGVQLTSFSFKIPNPEDKKQEHPKSIWLLKDRSLIAEYTFSTIQSVYDYLEYEPAKSLKYRYVEYRAVEEK